MKIEDMRLCVVCGTHFSASRPFCPVCQLRKAVTAPASSKRGASAKATRPNVRNRRFEHYELAKSADGRPVELGRGAMGVTYKAFDVSLRRPVTLKVIAPHCLTNPSTRSRFLREARIAASLRHPNVAAVFHLGRDGRNYFYAMEFVEGQTLQSLVNRSGHLDTKLALEIVRQVATGLAALNKEGLVHRDIKPSNIMVALDEAGGVTVKIVDLGLAKPITDPNSEREISTLGVFVGTPEFASPEQFAGIDVDIRSDLYSLGVTLWKMLTGRVPFQGTPAELMYQHLHQTLPSEQLQGVPQPVVVLLEILLEKDPKCRVQNPVELLQIIPAATKAIQSGRRFTIHRSYRDLVRSRDVSRRLTTKLGPKKVSIARLPLSGSDVFGREEDIAILDAAWADETINIVTVVAWAGVGKSTLVNHWLRRIAAENYRSAQFVFGWSFYRQSGGRDSFSSDEFIDSALSWFGDRDPRIGTAWEKGERLAKLIARHRTVLILDGLEPLQYPPGPQEGRLREPALQSLLRELAAFNKGLCLITTRQPVTDLADHERTSVWRQNLEQLSDDAGAQVLRALGVKGRSAELRSASREFGGHCLALTLLGSYLTDVYSGDIRYRRDVSKRLSQDVRQGVYARRVMESYQAWFGESRELAVLRMLGLFDRPTDEKTFKAILTRPVIRGLTESLTDLSPNEWETILDRLRKARLLAAKDPHEPCHLDTHPLVHEYFGEQLRSQRIRAWKECNRRLFHYYAALAPSLPESAKEMEPLFLAVIYGCKGGLLRQALHEVYISRIQRGEASFAANILGARGALLSALVQFFEKENWDSPVKTGVKSESLTIEDRLFILMQSAMYLTATRGMGAPEGRICYERAESLCQSLNRPELLYVTLMGQWRYSFVTDKLTATNQVAQRVYSLAQKQGEPAFLMGAHQALAITHYYLGNFESALSHSLSGVRLWRSGRSQISVEDINGPAAVCLCFQALAEWHLGQTRSCQATMSEAVSLAEELNDSYTLAVALCEAADLAHYARDPIQAERYAIRLIELTTRYDFAFLLAVGKVLHGWARSVLGDWEGGLAKIDDGLREYEATGTVVNLSHLVTLKSEALYEADRAAEALETLRKAAELVKRCEERWWYAELYRLRGVFLAALGAPEKKVEAAFDAAMRTARGQSSVSLARRAESTFSTYRWRKRKASTRHPIRLAL